VSIMLWSNANGFFRLLDRNEAYWRDMMGVNLQMTLRKSSALLIEAMMTEEAQRNYAGLTMYSTIVEKKEEQQ